ncbi:helix-turn-helix domain-containing protein [Nocardia farcinica]|nr:AraC family transcriptional regulator [Nocardia cyriacigeorgica]MBF6070655.1 helix-turn-helix domain-containing protein [Nocardia farcinica]MBF6461759.1 helix-turn-helix domain-containing protein [Nocardia puris]PEH76361.1 AraC family transcriptional regulator [Nocardia sp. FDAARGOS_372]UAK35443.1 AraC family transcriptional regulator [Nocardia asteroides]
MARAEVSAPEHRWSGGVSLTPGLMTFTGEIGDAAAHAHAAVQVLFVARGRLTLADAAGHTTPALAAIIPPGVVHQVSTEPGTSGFLAFLDPDSVTAHAALARLGGQPRHAVTSWVSVAAPLPAPPGGGPVTRSVRRASHPVVAEALRRATCWVGGPPSLGELAADIGISASRLSHIFTAQVGLPYVAWRRWVRLQLGFAVVREGGSLTEAAHTAGFADSAHLTRTCRDLIGISPTEALVATGWRPPPPRERVTTESR